MRGLRVLGRATIGAALVGVLPGVGVGAQELASGGGLLVEKVVPGQAMARAGVRVGDLLVRLEREATPPANPEPAGLVPDSPFEVAAFEIEQGSRGPVRASLRRDGEAIDVAVPPGFWGLSLRPALPAADAAGLDAALALERSGQVAEGQVAVEALAARLAAAGDTTGAVWARVRAAEELLAARKWVEGRKALQAVLTETGESARPAMRALVQAREAAAAEQQGDLPAAESGWTLAAELATRVGDVIAAEYRLRLAGVVRTRGDLARAQQILEEVLAVVERAAPGSLAVANVLNSLGTVASGRGDLALAQACYERSLAIREKLLPDSIEVAGSLHNLGVISRNRGDLDRAMELYGRSLALYRKLVPGSADEARALNSLGVLFDARGELGRSEDHYRQALAIREKLVPESLVVAGTLTNLGIIAYRRGDLAGSEALHERALAIRQRIAPDSPDVANSLNELGNLAQDRGQLDRALELYTRFLTVTERTSPDGPAMGTALRNVGEVRLLRGDYVQAEAAFARARVIDEKVSPGGLTVALDLRSLAQVARGRRDLGRAAELLGEARSILEIKAPGSLDLASVRWELGEVALAQGNRALASEHFGAAIGVRERLAPGSRVLAEALHSLGVVRREEGNLAEATGLFWRAVEAIEAQRGRLGGGREAEELFSAGFADFYRDLVEVEVRQGQGEPAFSSLERFRARVLLEMLAERDLDFSKDAPAELLSERERVDVAIRKAEDELGQPDLAQQADKVDATLARLADLRQRRQGIADRIRQASPRLASLQYPQPLDAAAAGRVIEDDTLLASFCVGREATYLLTLHRGRLETHTIAIGRTALAEKVREYRKLLADPGSPAAELRGQGRELGTLLLGPLQSRLRKAKRLMVCPDGPLNVLPFAALVLADGTWVAERLPSFQTLSVTVFAQDRRQHAARQGKPTVVAFGDPSYPGTEDEWKRAASWAAVRAGELSPLPATRTEVEAISGLFPERSRLYLGDRAREEEVKSLGGDVAFVHLACHGLLDLRMPLESGLALSVRDGSGAGDDGLLQAWEILEGVRLEAELVTLSACETGLGTEMGGEGLVGLTRAFLYAGARSVLSTFWSVADESTAELMTALYGELRRGRSKEVALQTSQQALIRGPARKQGGVGQDFSHPFFWAGFVLTGDWR
ncbi:MAG: CHAT domain-containing protein [Thermoanaerobaculaceae bacterium]|jgi:CHAT domain-containing protein/Tfp pilus assembly protein PilF|nr:CHAT domain-containing protein [Thermoanaerobaculaceae bacterium]